MIPTVTATTSEITASVDDTINIALDGTTTVVTLSTSAYEANLPVMSVNVANANLIRKNSSIYVITPNISTQIVFSSIPSGPVNYYRQGF